MQIPTLCICVYVDANVERCRPFSYYCRRRRRCKATMLYICICVSRKENGKRHKSEYFYSGKKIKDRKRKGEEDLFQAVEELVGEVGEKSLLALFSSTGEHLVEITVQECGLEVIDQIVLHRRQIDGALADPVHTSLPLHAFFHGHRRMKAQCERSLTASPCQRTTHRTKCFL
ncbi:hypothetical protein B296_00024951 [Ensete ventricosum]|uniref:Uncharacterized protein n=1 Tax=Ensete ventricosum TaxID=4639 RepID=A0A427ADZ9_ENSVE|nr:hypothetical protein B296_00024951 [Ensete ventricosum]